MIREDSKDTAYTVDEGVKFGFREFTDITSHTYTCSAGKADPLAQFATSTSTHFAVRMYV